MSTLPPEIEALAEHLDGVDAEWAVPIRAGLDMLRSGEASGLDDALGIAVTPHDRRLAAFEERDELILAMARRFFRGYPSANACAERMAERLSRYHSGQWRSGTRTAFECPHPVESLDSFCWQVFRAVDRPISQRRIRAILATDFDTNGQQNCAS